jgi:hypothetical protein
MAWEGGVVAEAEDVLGSHVHQPALVGGRNEYRLQEATPFASVMPAASMISLDVGWLRDRQIALRMI